MAEFSLVVSDHFQRQGLLGAELLSRLLQIGRDEKVRRIVGIIRAENEAMKGICQNLGFRLAGSDNREIEAEIDL